ncbi:potassium-transporting ATPase subunit KdpC [Aneurinibacillus danicus]|jgi:K+-transporting ATPase ATPase C chain|nr:potassium-transporting ATPase subunit KdpC [Aneurinibacillus danicus]
MMKSLFIAIRASILLMLVCGLLYPLLTTGIAQVLFPFQAQGSLVEDNGKVEGSVLLAQDFTSPKLFHPRASAAKYDPTASAATNAAVASPDYVKGIKETVDAVKKENPALQDNIPADLVTTSGSGFDPHLSPEAAKAQVPRIAKATGLSEHVLLSLIDKHTKGRQLGIFGEPRVNVLELNRDLLAQSK